MATVGVKWLNAATLDQDMSSALQRAIRR